MTKRLRNWIVRAGFTPAKRNAVRFKSESSMATSAGTFVAVPKHWGLEWVWPTRDWQTNVCVSGKDLHGMGSHLERAHGLQCLLLSL